jgi:flagella basal body P-ring formation protein FlgA
VVGWRVHGVPMQANSGSSPAHAAPAGPAIRRGDPVTLRIPGRGFAVAMRAIALEDAVVGARIRLRRASGPTTALFGIVTAPGEARPAG